MLHFLWRGAPYLVDHLAAFPSLLLEVRFLPIDRVGRVRDIDAGVDTWLVQHYPPADVIGHKARYQGAECPLLLAQNVNRSAHLVQRRCHLLELVLDRIGQGVAAVPPPPIQHGRGEMFLDLRPYGLPPGMADPCAVCEDARRSFSSRSMSDGRAVLGDDVPHLNKSPEKRWIPCYSTYVWRGRAVTA